MAFDSCNMWMNVLKYILVYVNKWAKLGLKIKLYGQSI